jgi:hypothetical protein
MPWVIHKLLTREKLDEYMETHRRVLGDRATSVEDQFCFCQEMEECPLHDLMHEEP